MPSLRPYRPRHFDDLGRFGAPHDGGYVVPRSALAACRTLLSLGVEADWSFEQAMLDMVPDLKVICVDGTTGPNVIESRYRRELRKAALHLRPYKFMDALKLRGKAAEFETFFARHTFLKLMVSPTDADGHTSLHRLLNRPDVREPIFLKMDIEGSEYEVLRSAATDLARFVVIAIEFHDLGTRWPEFEQAMALLQRSHHIAHLHGNNYHRPIPGTNVPRTLEATFVQHALCRGTPPASARSYPLPCLDSPNKRRRADLPLHFD